ncbi:MAG: sensor histidine kinase [Solirubrobacterales bacterium]
MSLLLLATLVLALAGLSIRAGRRRHALNEALHELRRPLQTMALTAPNGTVQLALSALSRLDAELNGRERERRLGPVPCRALVEGAIGRWRSRAGLAGGRIELRWRAGVPVLRGDRAELSQALDNLIVNAIEHGGPLITIDAVRRGESLRIAVADNGHASRPPFRADSPAEVVARLRGRARHGHGLNLVRRVAAAHGGRFAFERSEGGSMAVLELPLAG